MQDKKVPTAVKLRGTQHLCPDVVRAHLLGKFDYSKQACDQKR